MTATRDYGPFLFCQNGPFISMAGKVILLTNLLPLDAVSLGRFVVDVEYPQRRYHDPFPGRALSSTVQAETDVKESAQRRKNKRAGLFLTELFSLIKRKRSAHGFEVRAVSALTYVLNQWDSIFRSACALEDTRRWLEDVIEDGKDVYFTVGYRTVVDPVAKEDVRIGRASEQSVQLPVSTIAEANLYGIQLGGVLDPAVSWTREKSDLAGRSFKMSGECVHSVQYCKVNFKWFSTRKVESSLLGENKWRVCLGVRGEEEDDNADDNTVEAQLVEDW